MVDMQVGVDHDINVLGADSLPFKLVQQVAGPVAAGRVGTRSHARVYHEHPALGPQSETSVV